MEGSAINYRNVSLSIIVAALVLIMSSACSKRDDKPKVHETYKIGVALPLTGPAAFMGEGIRDAMLMARERSMEKKYNYELIFEDSRHDPTVSAALANKFITVDNVDAIVSVGDESGPVVSPIAAKHEVPHFAIAVQKFVARGKYNFTHWTPATERRREV